MTPSTSIPPDEAAELLESVETAREAAEQRMGAYWFPLVVVGGLLLATSWFFSVWDGGAVALFWLVVAPFALFAVKRYERVQLRASGAVRDRRAHLTVAGAFIAACVVLGAIGGVTGERDLINYGPLFGVAAVYAAVAWRDRSRRLTAWAVGVSAFALTSPYILPSLDDPARVMALVTGANLVIEGFAERNRRGA